MKKPDNTPSSSGVSKPFQFLGFDLTADPSVGPTTDKDKDIPPKKAVSPDFQTPFFEQISRIYLPLWVGDPQVVIANHLRSLLADLEKMARSKNLLPDETIGICFQYRKSSSNPTALVEPYLNGKKMDSKVLGDLCDKARSDIPSVSLPALKQLKDVEGAVEDLYHFHILKAASAW